MRELIRKLVETYGPSGVEDQIRTVIHTEVKPLADEIRIDPLGSLVARKKGSDEGQRIVLSAHMDEIGVMVTYIDEQDPPFVIIHGDNDQLVPLGQSIILAEALIEAGIEEVTMKTIRDAGHGGPQFHNAESRQLIEDFLLRNLKEAKD